MGRHQFDMSALNDPRRVPRNLRELREHAGLSQDELAARIEISQSKLSRAERGYQSLTEAESRTAATVLGVAIDALFCNANGEGQAAR